MANVLQNGIRVLMLALILAFTWTAPAQSDTAPADELPPPGTVVESVFDQALVALLEHQDAIRKDPKVAHDLMDAILAPHMDFNLMSRLVLGRASRDASEEQMEQFQEAFREHTVRTYASMLSDNVDTVVEKVNESAEVVEIAEATEPDDRGRVSVSTRLKVQEPPIPVTYRMIATEDGWRVYDVVIENISFVTNFRNEFGSEVRRIGLDGLIERMQKRNRQAWED